VLSSVAQAVPGQSLQVRVVDGRVAVEVTGTTEDPIHDQQESA
jgi:hypothetical protein